MRKVIIHHIEHELTESFVSASGPGGQNVNKVASAVQLRFNPGKSAAFTDDAKALMARNLGSKLTTDGDLIVFAQSQRSQARNREEARERLIEMLEKALIRPRRRIATKPSKSSQRRRVDTKVKRGEVKKNRGKVDEE